MRRWHDVTGDPNSPEARAYRHEQLQKARADDLIYDRPAYLAELVRGKALLDVGVVDHTVGSANNAHWLHRRLRDSAASCLGVDILEHDVAELTKMGFNVVVADITREPLPHKFEIITCGEVIEHLDRPGDLFRNAREMLHPGGRLVLSTPNPWFVNVLLKNIRDGLAFVESVDHVAWFDPGTLCELAERQGFELQRFTGVGVSGRRKGLAGVLFAMQPLLVQLGIRREIFAPTLIYEFVLSV